MASQSEDGKRADGRTSGDAAQWSIIAIILLLSFGYWAFREKPVPPPDPMVYTGKRLPIQYGVRQAQLSQNGWVVTLSGVPDGQFVHPLWCRVNGKEWTEITKWDHKRRCDIGWLELGRALTLKDQLEIWAPGYDPATIRLDTDSPNKATLRK